MSLLVPYKGNSDFGQGVREQGGSGGNPGQKAKMAPEAFWKPPSLGAICSQSVCVWLGVGGVVLASGQVRCLLCDFTQHRAQ